MITLHRKLMTLPRKHLLSHSFHAACLVAGLIAAQIANSSPWVEVGDERTRHHLQMLADTGKVTVPLTSWPMMWSGIKLALDSVRVEELNEAELWSYRYLRHQLERAMRGGSASLQLHGSNTAPGLTDFRSNIRDASQASASLSFLTNSLSASIRGTAVADPIDGETTRADGSYVAGTFGNWVLGGGAIDQWWGPGWSGSMILGNSARPSPGLFFQRRDTSASRSPLTRWLGGWDLKLFANQLNDDVYPEDSKLGGARVTFKPLSFFEFGYSATRHWGLKDEQGESSHYRLQGFDWRLGRAFRNVQAAIYQQRINRKSDLNEEDATAQLLGFEFGAVIMGLNSRLAIEHQDTRNDQRSIFDHPVYTGGYRYYGNSLATAIDTASELLQLSADHYFAGGQQFSWQLGKASLNDDNIALSPPAGHPYGPELQDVDFGRITFKAPVNNWLQLQLGAIYCSEKLSIAETDISSGGYLQLNFEF